MASYHDYDWQMKMITRINSPFNFSSINIRKTPFLTAGVVTNLKEFNPVLASAKTYTNDGHDWYKVIDDSGYAAYVSSQVVSFGLKVDPPPETRYIIDLHPDTLIVSAGTLPIVQEIVRNFCRNLLDRVNNPKLYEENDNG